MHYIITYGNIHIKQYFIDYNIKNPLKVVKLYFYAICETINLK